MKSTMLSVIPILALCAVTAMTASPSKVSPFNDAPYRGAGYPMRRAGLDALSGMAFGEQKRSPFLLPVLYARPQPPQDKRRTIYGQGEFDEIDRAGFPGFMKRSNFDEIDRYGFPGFNKRYNFDEIDRYGFPGFNKRYNFDEIDRYGFPGFNKRYNFDEIDRYGFPGFMKRSDSESGSKSNSAPKTEKP